MGSLNRSGAPSKTPSELPCEMYELSRVDLVGLRRLESLVRSDADGVAEFGGFYGQAVRRLGPLLGPNRRAWLLIHDGSPTGFLDADAEGGRVGLAWFVAEPYRRRRIATTALMWLLTSETFPDATRFQASIAPGNVASRTLARRAGFSRISTTDKGDELWGDELWGDELWGDALWGDELWEARPLRAAP